MRKHTVKPWTVEDLNQCLGVKSLGSLEHFLSCEGYSAEDLIRPIGDEQTDTVIEESVRSAKIRMRQITKRINP